MDNIHLKIGQFYNAEKKLSIPVIRLAYAGMPTTGVISLVCLLGVGQGATSFNLFVKLNQSIKLGIDIFKTVTVTGMSSDGEEISLKIED